MASAAVTDHDLPKIICQPGEFCHRPILHAIERMGKQETKKSVPLTSRYVSPQLVGIAQSFLKADTAYFPGRRCGITSESTSSRIPPN